MRVLSCFDGISCGQVALERAGIPVTTYFASEIDKHAIKITQHNWPNTIQLGDVKSVLQMAAFGIFGEIDLLIGGSPCQGFSNAGKQLGFVDPRSMLLYDFLMIKNYLQPKWFLLENVKMKKSDQDAISQMIGCEPVFINSADFSAQNRQRFYWTNIPVKKWADKGILLKDILEHLPSDNKGLSVRKKISFPPPSNGQFLRVSTSGKKKKSSEKAGCLTAGGNCESFTRRYSLTEWERLQTLPNGYIKVMKYKVNETPSRERMWADGFGTGNKGSCANITHMDKSLCLTTKVDRWSNAGLVEFEDFCRYLTPTEYERLQTLPDDYTQVVSDSQRYKAIGNGWTVDVIAHILGGINAL